ncbi:GDP-mannose 4,6-dehydratase [Paraburkholderia caballeronis]|uniref:GDP-D-mannose dehydratase n=1 Tax=Paraburkholderia caballeronis TaxID=416943 RepID=A0A1H7S223_9BURK|nr:GDP-mannose 4,6-dehydratase [Paraburkholderia caballeronis]PXW22831.1 GDP-D-mannose dehydratase [Paraburkholderia caballeronis]PXW97216.1 GDP-D-mannose dehydratase [Paraburkholderia caballeronis]RAJ93736.1 GDP-D-mannose dehydratase [Paraburkholderia caballeronis]TDV14002.1 GDP-D-mannose dehydratase [Paraburkholderia caballeronis]TDV15515.1 GDP-D-mannose dehydratase [Paraburkholderia caballeronis]
MTPSDNLGARALITGLGGFTGRYMAERLRADGYRIHGTVQGAADLDAIDAAAHDVHAVDLRDPRDVAAAIDAIRPDVVVHLAGIANVAHGDIANTWLVNVVGTRNLLAALARLDRPPRAVLLASSANVYGNATEGVIDETVPPEPANDYAASKLAMEFASRTFSARLPLIFARPFNYTGVGQSADFLLPKIVEHYARRAKTISLGNTDVSRDFSDVRFVVDAYARLLHAAPRGEIFNVCSGVGRTLGDVLDTLARVAGYRIDVRIDPRFVRPNEVRTLTGSNAKLRDAIGELQPVPLEETLRWMYEDARERYESLRMTA